MPDYDLQGYRCVVCLAPVSYEDAVWSCDCWAVWEETLDLQRLPGRWLSPAEQAGALADTLWPMQEPTQRDTQRDTKNVTEN